jgi:hypothetical protein
MLAHVIAHRDFKSAAPLILAASLDVIEEARAEVPTNIPVGEQRDRTLRLALDKVANG